MDYGWSRVKRYSLSGWKHASTRLFILLFAVVIILSRWGRPPFWLTFLSTLPLLLLYFPMVGFFMELLDRDWKDWHPW